MDKLLRFFGEKALIHKLVMTMKAAPNGEIRIHVFSEGTGKHPIEGSDTEVAFAQDNDIDKCANQVIRSIEKWVENREVQNDGTD